MNYYEFVEERHRIWERRQAGEPGPWTEDPVLATRKFTNVFRILDHGSQFLVRELLFSEAASRQDILMRCFLYRYTNRPEPWQHFYWLHARYPTYEDLRSGSLLRFWQKYNGPIFGNAYKMFSGSENKGMSRLEWAVGLTEKWITEKFTREFFYEGDRFDCLTQIPRCKNFMAMQVLTDVSYRMGWSENEFIVPGPGALVGAKAVDPIRDPEVLIRDLADHWRSAGTVTLPSGRTPSLMDVQNTLCEYGKYVRWGPAKKPYRPAHPKPARIFLPPHYERNHR